MKNSIRYIIVALCAILLVVGVCCFTSGAANETNVIYIADDASKGDGSGSSPDNPLRAEERVTRSAPEGSDGYKYYFAVGSDGTTSDSSKRFYYNSVLYQASEKLASTGGKIVLVGDVVIDFSKTYSGSSKTDRDFFMYTYGDKQITITAQNDAKLVLTEGARLTLGGKTVFEDITIATGNTANSTADSVKNRSISCYGYETLFGYGIKCVNLDGNKAASYYPIISGGKRYGDITSNTNVTIKSGTWNNVFGGNYGNGTNTITGETNVVIDGGTFLGSVVAGSRNSIHNGNSNLTINGGEFKGAVLAESAVGVTSESSIARINIFGGSFSSASAVKKMGGAVGSGKYAPKLLINLSQTNITPLEIGYVLKDTDADTIVYPMNWCTDIELVSPATSSSCKVGGVYDPAGLKIKLTFENGSNTYESEIEYSKFDTNFEFEYNSSLIGIGELVCKYAGRVFDKTQIAIINKDTLYISNTALGKGDGSSPENAMGPTIVVERDPALGTDSREYKYYLGKKVNESGNVVEDPTRNFQKNSVLYQAYEKLAQTGGKIVMVGDVQFDFSTSMNYNSIVTRDVYLPDHTNYPIVISAQNGARLKITDGVILNLGGPTVFENMTFATGSTELSAENSQYNRAICASGNPVIFGKGITCVNDDGETQAKAYIGINGGTRYTNLVSDSNVVIKSGKWAYAAGSSYGMEGYYHTGNIRMVIDGGEFLGNVSAVTRDNSDTLHFGDSELTINGGSFYGAIVGYGRMGTGFNGSVVKITVNGGEFLRSGTSAVFSYRYAQHSRGSGITATTILDLSECTTFTDFSKVSGNFNKVYYPASLCTAVTVNTNTTNTKCFINEGFEAPGLKVTATFKDVNNTTKTSTFTYDDVPHAFDFVADTSKAGNTQMKWYVGDVNFKTTTLDVVSIPVPTVLGAQVRTENSSDNLDLRFVAEVKKPYGNGVNVTDYGFVAINDYYLLDKNLLVLDGFYGPHQVNGNVFRAEAGSVYNSDKKMTFAGVYPNLPLNEYNTDISVVAYVKFTYDGKTYVRYSDRITRNVIEVANAAMASRLESDEGKNWMQTNLINAFKSYTSSNMIDAENANALRAEVVNAFNESATFAWVPSSKIELTYDTKMFGNVPVYDLNNTYNVGTTYYGIPYFEESKATLEEFQSYVTVYGGKNYYVGPIAGYKDIYDGVITDEKYEKYLPYVEEDMIVIEDYFPACDYSVVTNAWNKVTSNKVWTTTIQSFIPNQGRGTVAVGSYNCGSETNTKTIAQTTNGQTKMNAAYALCKPGDALVSTSSSAVYMVMEAATDSNVKVCYNVEKLDTSKKTHFKTETVSFSTLYNNGFIPVTIPELATGLRSETTTVLSNFDGEKAIKDGIMNGVIESSRQIISVNVSILRQGKAIYEDTKFYNSPEDLNTNRVNLVEFNIANPVKFMVEGATYTIRISAKIGGLSSENTDIVLEEYAYTKPVIDATKYAAFSTTFAGYDFESYKEDLAQGAIDHMYEMYNSYYWSPEFDFQQGQKVSNEGEFVPSKIFYASNIYKGIMYADMRATLRDFSSYMGDMQLNSSHTSSFGTNVYTFELPEDAKYTDGSGNVRYDWTMFMGNHCSAAMFHAYNQTSRIGAAGSRHNPDLKLVGFEDDVFYSVSGAFNDTRNITKAYGETAMYLSYAQAQKGDYMYRNTGGGHTRMVKEVYVARKSDGTIDAANSWLRVVEQTDTPVSMKELRDTHGCDITDAEYNASNMYSTWYMNKKYTFEKLFEQNIVIYRPLEYITNESERPYVLLKSPITAKMLENTKYENGKITNYISGLIESNYPIIALKIEIKDTSGNVVANAVVRELGNVYSYNVKTLSSKLSGYPTSGTYKLYLTAELSAGETVLIDGLQFTK